MKDIYIIGAGGLGREVACLISRINHVSPTWNIAGFIDDNPQLVGTTVNGINVVGNTEYLNGVADAYAVCAIGFASVRQRAISRITSDKIQFATLIDPSAIIADNSYIGIGSIISMNTVITTNTTVGDHVLVNYGSTIGHDVTLLDYTTIYPGANISGNVSIGPCTEVGTGSQVIQGKSISSDIIIGAGSVVIEDLKDSGTYVGVPTRKVR